MYFNYPLEISLFTMMVAQFLKLPIHYFIYKKWIPSILFSTGGMPSSHSAVVSALTLSLALTEGVASPLFAISFVLAGIVIHDSIGIRREAGKHATVLNDMKKEFYDIINELNKGKAKNKLIVDKRLKELLGHEPIEVISGMLLGITIVLSTYFIFI